MEALTPKPWLELIFDGFVDKLANLTYFAERKSIPFVKHQFLTVDSDRRRKAVDEFEPNLYNYRRKLRGPK